MSNDGVAITFPVYSLLLKDATGVILLEHGEELWLPLFTDKDALETFLGRSSIRECSVVQMAGPKELTTFLRNPPSRSRNSRVQRVVMDPIDQVPRVVSLFEVADLIARLEAV